MENIKDQILHQVELDYICFLQKPMFVISLQIPGKAHFYFKKKSSFQKEFIPSAPPRRRKIKNLFSTLDLELILRVNSFMFIE